MDLGEPIRVVEVEPSEIPIPEAPEREQVPVEADPEEVSA